MLNIAHRGFSGKYPENTLLAFEKAIQAGADGAELDVHLTKDNVIVVIHDELINRTTDGDGFVADYTYNELCRFDASASFRGVYGFNKIPTLREYFELVKPVDGFITNIELKTGENEYPGIEKAVYDLIKEYELEDRIIISSFNHFSVMRFKGVASKIKCGYLTGDWIYDFGEYTQKRGVECVHPRYNSLNSESVAEIKNNNIQINTWTVNTEAEVERLYSLGIDAVISNYPDMVKSVIERIENKK